MHVDISAFVRSDTVVTAREYSPHKAVLSFGGEGGSGDDVTLYFDSLAGLRRVADVILSLEAGEHSVRERLDGQAQ